MRYTKKEYFKQMIIDQLFYEHSLRARILRNDSYMLSRFFYHLRMMKWYELAPHFGNKVMVGWHKFRLRKYGSMMGLQLSPNTLGFGVNIIVDG